MLKDFVFITDVHIGAGSNVRTGNPFEDLNKKLLFVQEYCNTNNCQLLIGGDFFDKPTIPDVYKTPVIKILRDFQQVPYCIQGNHDQLMGTTANDFKTSLNLLFEAGLLKQLDFEDLGDLVLTSRKPLTTIGKPQIFVYHGFLNQEDSGWQVMFQDLSTNDETICLLGHDHVVYDPVQIGNVKVIRPGSFLRGIRNSESQRQPQLVHIKFNPNWEGKKLRLKFVEIPARPWQEIFKTKQSTINQKEKQLTYDSIITQIVNASQQELSLIDAVSTVSTAQVTNYVKMSLDEAYQKVVSK